jgi:hypothetical protein
VLNCLKFYVQGRATVLVLIAMTGAALAQPADAKARAQIRTSDVDLFYRVFDAAHGRPTAEALQHDYIDAGSDAVRQFVPNRIVSGSALATTIAKHRDVYDQARGCMHALPAVKAKLEKAFGRLAAIDRNAEFPPVTILVGRNNSGGTTGKSGVLIGLEVACRSSWPQADLTERLFHLIAHEYGHVEQSAELNDESKPTSVLRQSLIEGGAELIGARISGQASNVHLQRWTRGRVRAIDEQFLAEADSPDISHWLYNGVGTPEQPGDLGYWVGDRIARAYYDKATDKAAALQDLLALKDPRAILAASGWRPGQII